MVESFHMLWGFKHYTEQLAETRWREQVPFIHHKLFALHCAVSGNICLQFKLHLSLKLTSLESLVWRHPPDEAIHLGSNRTIRPCRWKSSSRETRGETNPANERLLSVFECSCFVWSQIKTQALWVDWADLFPPYLIGLSWISLHCCTVK